MTLEWIVGAFGDLAWIIVAFGLGFLARLVKLPPMVGFLLAGFLLNGIGVTNDPLLQRLSDLGVTLLLFSVGLKLNLGTLTRPQVWAVTGIHSVVVIIVITALLHGLALAGATFFLALDFQQSVLVAFALSFSSTVFVVKVLEEKGEVTSLHGRIAIGILVMQDIAAVVFLALSSGKIPSPWAFLLLLLIPARPVLHTLLQRVGHGELLVLYGFLLALGGAEVFELVELKGDLGALILGLLIANHVKAEELAKTMLGFKDLFLLGFFLSIGLSAELTTQTFVLGVMITPLIFLKAGLFFGLLVMFKLRARTSLLTTLSLTNYSEFGLIVIAIAVSNSWLGSEWLVVLSIALSLSFVVSAGLNAVSHWLYTRYRDFWRRMQRAERIADDRLLDLGGATIAVIGMGGVGTGAYDAMRAQHGETVIGVDIDPITVANQRATGRNVLLGDPSDTDFWDRVQESHALDMVLLSLPNVGTNLEILDRLRDVSFSGEVAALAKFPDQVEALRNAGAAIVFNMYTEAGAGFAAHVEAHN